MQNRKYKTMEPDRSWNDFRTRLKQLMDSRGYNMAETSKLLDINPTSISRYFKGERGPDILALWRIADKFDVSLDWLIGRTDNKDDSLLPKEREVITKYAAATDNDKIVSDTILQKYDV